MNEEQIAAQNALIAKLKTEVEGLIASKDFAGKAELELLKAKLETSIKPEDFEAVKAEAVRKHSIIKRTIILFN